MGPYLINLGKFLLHEDEDTGSAPPTNDLILEDGFYFLLEDGSSKILLE